uniref:TrmB family transcriptional regulator n=1 Tax=Acetatifactor sp. TaxID=1872090 RepID=UPI004057C723
MEEAGLIDKLMLFGLSRQEACIYLCLLKDSELTGYEVAKLTGISRSNVYNGLAGLVEHGAAYVLEGSTTRYTAVDIKEFCDNKLHYLQKTSDYLIHNAPKKTLVTEGYITIEGYQHICDKIHHMLINAEKRIYFSAESIFLEKWENEILYLMEKQIKIVLVSNVCPSIFTEKANEDGIIFYKLSEELREERTEPDRDKQIRLIIDSEYVLTGVVSGNRNDACLYSAQKNFVNVFKDAMRNEIELIKLIEKREEK